MPELIEKYKNTEFTLSISLDGPKKYMIKLEFLKELIKKL